jgi:hypothetical protein
MLRSRPGGSNEGPWASAVGDQECLALLRLLIEETRITVQKSRVTIASTQDAIAMLDRTGGTRISSRDAFGAR